MLLSNGYRDVAEDRGNAVVCSFVRDRRGRRMPSSHLLVALMGVVFISSCGGTSAGGGESSVDVTLKEWEVVPAGDSASSGEITFQLENQGKETHEFVVIKTDLDPTELPTAEDGSVDEAGSGMEVVDEVEDLPSGESEELTVELEPGGYALLCNIVEEANGEVESHYDFGMRTGFTVE